jgi:hypothetical protein
VDAGTRGWYGESIAGGAFPAQSDVRRCKMGKETRGVEATPLGSAWSRGGEDAVTFECGCRWRHDAPARCPLHRLARRKAAIIEMPARTLRLRLVRSA